MPFDGESPQSIQACCRHLVYVEYSFQTFDYEMFTTGPIMRRCILHRLQDTCVQVFKVVAAILVSLVISDVMANDNESGGRQIDLVIEDGPRLGGDDAVVVTQGDDVVIQVVSDADAQLRLHGYDLNLDVAPGELGTLSFHAELSGRFPLTLHSYGGVHGEHAPLLYLDVYPD